MLRLFDEGAPLSRNKHFQTFETPEGKAAMKLSRRLRALQKDIVACAESGGATVVRRSERDGEVKVEISFQELKGKRLTLLREGEFELLTILPGVKRALRE